jgi:porin
MYYAAQLGYTLEGDQGAGNYRVYGFMTSVDFVDAVQLDEYQRLQGLGISADQQVTEHFGLFARLGWQDDAAAVDHNQLYSGGVNINGGIWGRSEDEIGIGYAYLKGAEGSGLEKTQAFEAYIKIKFLAYADFTTDIQYISDKGSIKNSVSPEGRIIGVRFNAYF